MVYLAVTREFGRGLYAAKHISESAPIFACELLVLSPSDTIQINKTELQFYTFKYSENQDCLVLGLGEIFNHSDTPNCSYRLVDSNDGTGRKLMLFTCIRSIAAGEQLFIDYSADVNVETNNYKVNLIG